MAKRLAHEQAALRRVATLVAQGAQASEVFATVVRQVAEVMHLPVAAVQRYDDDAVDNRERRAANACWLRHASCLQLCQSI
jgi:hypothetical protein